MAAARKAAAGSRFAHAQVDSHQLRVCFGFSHRAGDYANEVSEAIASMSPASLLSRVFSHSQ